MKPSKSSLGRTALLLILVSVCAVGIAAAQETPRLSMDYNPAVFTVVAGMNACGYNDDLDDSLPLRQAIRNDIAQAVGQSVDAQVALDRWCKFYTEHKQPDQARQLAQYISLAINLNEPPALSPRLKEADMPPDTNFVLGAIPLLQNFYITANLNRIFNAHRKDYEGLIEKYHDPVNNLLFSTDVYLKQQISSYVGRSFIIYLEPMAPPSQVNSRNYGDDYFMVISPTPKGLKLDQIRHTYLHYILDPLALKYAHTVRNLSPLLKYVQNAPLEEGYKTDVSLLVTESLIRAIEARLTGGPKAPEAAKQAEVNKAMREGFILTQHFYDELVRFEKDPAGLKDSYSLWLKDVYLPREQKRAQSITWAQPAAPEVVSRTAKTESLIDQAERQLASGNLLGAEKLAQESIAADQAADRSHFVLARVATQRGKMKEAQAEFEAALQTSKDSRIRAWSEIYLGRIADLMDNRDEAVTHYKAALAAGDNSPDIKTAAERGLQQPFQPPKQN